MTKLGAGAARVNSVSASPRGRGQLGQGWSCSRGFVLHSRQRVVVFLCPLRAGRRKRHPSAGPRHRTSCRPAAGRRTAPRRSAGHGHGTGRGTPAAARTIGDACRVRPLVRPVRTDPAAALRHLERRPLLPRLRLCRQRALPAPPRESLPIRDDVAWPTIADHLGARRCLPRARARVPPHLDPLPRDGTPSQAAEKCALGVPAGGAVARLEKSELGGRDAHLTLVLVGCQVFLDAGRGLSVAAPAVERSLLEVLCLAPLGPWFCDQMGLFSAKTPKHSHARAHH